VASVSNEQGALTVQTQAAPKMVKFADFEVIELIGEGSFGRVFKVKKRDTGRIYAMKSMKKSLLIQ